MKAVVCEAFGGPEVLALRDVPDPPTPGPGEVQVRITARGVQYVDVLMLAGKYQFRPEPPFIPGNEAAGEVVAVGDGVTRFKVGDPVMNRVRLGAFGTLANSKEVDCDPIPAGMSVEEAAVFRGAHHTAYHALIQRGRMQAGDWVLIHGAAGGIGIAAIQVAKLYGARVIATASTDEKRAACLEEGADFAINYREGFRDRVKEITGAHDGVDHLLRPFRPLRGVLFLRADDAAGMVLPDIAGEAQDAPADFEFAERVERLGDDVAVDLHRGERRRHVGRLHDLQTGLVRRWRRGFDDGRQAALTQRILQHDIVHRIPERHGDLPAAEIGERANVRFAADNEARTVGMRPSHDLDRHAIVVAHPQRDRFQEVNQIELAGGESLDKRRPAANEGRLLGFQPFIFEIAFRMGHEQRGRVCNRQIADAHDVIIDGAGESRLRNRAE